MLETKLREFQYKVLNNIVFTNENLFKIKMFDSPLCTFCKIEIESLEHLFYNYEITRSFWVALRSWRMECNINLEPFSVFDVLFGIFVVVQFYPWFKFCFPLFWGMVMYDNGLKQRKIKFKPRIKLNHNILNEGEDFVIVNHLILVAKFCIKWC